MEIKIHSVHFHADQKLIDFINDKLSRIEQIFDKIQEAEVFLKLDANSHEVRDKIAEIKLNLPGKILFCEERSKVFEESVDEAVGHMLRQVKKYKEKIQGE